MLQLCFTNRIGQLMSNNQLNLITLISDPSAVSFFPFPAYPVTSIHSVVIHKSFFSRTSKKVCALSYKNDSRKESNRAHNTYNRMKKDKRKIVECQSKYDFRIGSLCSFATVCELIRFFYTQFLVCESFCQAQLQQQQQKSFFFVILIVSKINDANKRVMKTKRMRACHKQTKILWK